MELDEGQVSSIKEELKKIGDAIDYTEEINGGDVLQDNDIDEIRDALATLASTFSVEI